MSILLGLLGSSLLATAFILRNEIGVQVQLGLWAMVFGGIFTIYGIEHIINNLTKR